jgi:hypothetical protein
MRPTRVSTNRLWQVLPVAPDATSYSRRKSLMLARVQQFGMFESYVTLE